MSKSKRLTGAQKARLARKKDHAGGRVFLAHLLSQAPLGASFTLKGRVEKSPLSELQTLDAVFGRFEPQQLELKFPQK